MRNDKNELGDGEWVALFTQLTLHLYQYGNMTGHGTSEKRKNIDALFACTVLSRSLPGSGLHN